MNMKIHKGVLIGVCCFIAASFGAKSEGTRIQDGVLTYSAGHYLEGQPIPLGYDPFGYNYQGHLFVGLYANVYLGRDGFPPYEGDDEAYLAENPSADSKWYWPYRDVELVMKWNDAWLANSDRDDDGKLDRHYGYDSYIGSGAWETNQMLGTYELDGQIITWTSFTKIVAIPDDATLDDGIWYAADGTEIGLEIWGSFAIIEDVYNDPGEGIGGPTYISPSGPGFGKW